MAVYLSEKAGSMLWALDTLNTSEEVNAKPAESNPTAAGNVVLIVSAVNMLLRPECQTHHGWSSARGLQAGHQPQERLLRKVLALNFSHKLAFSKHNDSPAQAH